MGECQACAHFTVDDKHPPYGSCSRWNVGYGAYYPPYDEPMALNEVLVENDEGWGMVVGPQFGCVLYEPKSV